MRTCLQVSQSRLANYVNFMNTVKWVCLEINDVHAILTSLFYFTFDPKKNSFPRFSAFSQRFIRDFVTPRHTECIQSITKPFTRLNGLKRRNTEAPLTPLTCQSVKY